jgi:hypothetical protein
MNEVVINKPKPDEDPAHVEAMVAKAEGREPAPEPAAPAERPAWLPEGFNTPEELAAAYADATKAKTPEAAPEATPEAAAAAVADAGLDMTALETKVATNGTLDDADYAALEAKGISRAMVDSYIDGQKAVGEALLGRIHAHAGGVENFNTMVSWAAAGGLTQAEAEAFNAVVDTGNEGQLKLALDGLAAKFNAAGQNAPKLLGGGRTGASTDSYESVAQMMADMRDARYAKDSAFRNMVADKLSRSSIM